MLNTYSRLINEKNVNNYWSQLRNKEKKGDFILLLRVHYSYLNGNNLVKRIIFNRFEQKLNKYFI
jgi:hypothetical protein